MKQWLLLLVVVVVYLCGFFLLDRWKTTLYYGDSNSYYLHLVSFFIYQDVGNYDASITSLRKVNPSSPDPRKDEFGIRLTKKGRRYIKYTLGVPVMEAPFFLIAHAYAKVSGTYAANGWSPPYLLAVGLSTLCYLLLGFYLLIKILKEHFPARVMGYTILALALATNLFYHATYVTMAHGFLFFDYCLLIYLSIAFYQKPGALKALGIGAVVGLITLTRVPEIISALIPLLWGINSREGLKERVRFLKKHYFWLLWAAFAFLAVFSIQFVYWHYVSGQLIFNPYEGEGFNFLKPRIHKGWFDFANGWLVYSPIMAFSLLGLFFLRRYYTAPFWPTLAFVGLHAYIHYSYYAWTYFPGLGQRPMVETYPLLAFGLAAAFLFFSRRRWLALIPLPAIVLFSSLNFFQTWQMKKGIIWPERGSWGFYYETFGTLSPSLEALRAYDTGKIQPDSAGLTFVKNLASEDFEHFDYSSADTTIPHQGKFSLLTTEEKTELIRKASLPEAEPGDWLRIGIHGYMRGADRIWHRDQTAMLFFELHDGRGKKRKFAGIRISPHIGNKDYNIWTAGEPDQWGEAAFFIKVPWRINPDWTFRAYIKNPAMQKIYLDDLRVDLYRKL